MSGSNPATLRRVIWPAADRRAWQAALSDDGLLGDSGPAAHHCARMRTDLARSYDYLLRFASERGELDQLGAPAAVMRPKMVDAYIQDLGRRVGSVTQHRYLYRAMRVAEYLAPERDWSWLRRRVRRLAHLARPRNKRPRVVTTDRIVALGMNLMAGAELREPKRFSDALAYRDGLLLVFLALCPLRRSNFAALRLGQTLHRLESCWVVAVPGEESKTGRPYESLLPEVLTDPLDRFLAIWRPLFRDSADHLWPSRNGGALTAWQIFSIIRRLTQQEFGHALSPHLFRDCAATTVAIKKGAEMGTAVALLGHRNRRVIDKHYNQADMLHAVSRYQDILD